MIAAKMPKVLKVLNFWGTSNGRIFTVGVLFGQERRQRKEQPSFLTSSTRRTIARPVSSRATVA